MPSNLETYSTCAGPGTAVPHARMGGLTGTVIQGWETSDLTKALTLVIGGALIVALALAFGWGAICAFAPIAILCAVEIKDWYYNRRLLCIRDRDCAVGEVVAEPDVATDGDRKLNLLLNPLRRSGVATVVNEHLMTNQAMLTTPDPQVFPAAQFPSGPPVFDLSDTPKYMGSLLGGDTPSYVHAQISIGIVARILAVPENTTYGRFYRKDAAQITDVPTFDYIPTDFAPADNPTASWEDPAARSNWTGTNRVDDESGQSLNSMFRFDSDHLVPYLHCEIEGHNIAIWMDDIITAASGLLLGCLICGPLCGIIAGALFWLFKKLLDWLTGNDGDAGSPGVDWAEPGEAEDVHGRAGDVVAVYGNWIMDTEHGQYFEVHPVRAYYVLSPTESGEYQPSEKDAAEARRRCGLMSDAEETDRPEQIEKTEAEALSWGLTTNYAGGGGNAPPIR